MTRSEYITYMLLWMCVADIDITDDRQFPYELVNDLCDSYYTVSLDSAEEQMDNLLYIAELTSLKNNSKLGDLL